MGDSVFIIGQYILLAVPCYLLVLTVEKPNRLDVDLCLELLAKYKHKEKHKEKKAT